MTAGQPCRAELQAIAAELRASLTERLSSDQQAYAALFRDGELYPWTEPAEDLWTQVDNSDPWRDHHLAILHHAKAYDLETAGSPEAFRYWTAALGHWSAVHADDSFWARMTQHLSERMRTEITPAVVDRIRARLPRELLEPHRDLIATYWDSDPERAKSHMRIMASAPFHPDVIDGIRLQFTEEVLATVPDAVMTGDFDKVIDNLNGWQHIDPDNAHLLRSLLYVYRKFNEQVWDADDGLTRVSRNVAAAQQILQDIGVPPPDTVGATDYAERLKALRPGGMPPGTLTAEIARQEVWRGLVSYRTASRRFSWNSYAGAHQECARSAAKAVEHFAVARQLDPDLALDHYYSALPTIEAGVESLWGLCMLAQQHYVPAAQHFRRASSLDPSDADSFLGLAQALLLPDITTNAALREAEQAISHAEALEADVRTPRKLLELRRAVNLRL